MLWAWETPEDFTALAPERAGVAFLSRELLLTSHLAIRPRYQPLRVAPGAWLMAVVRIEIGPHFVPSDDLAERSSDAIAEAARLPNVRAVQVDFDATVSERDFYTAVLRELHSKLPPGFPLSVTALASWCGPRSWLRDLPVEEAVPMFFRMGGSASVRAKASRSQSMIAEPRCSGSAGISTDETWPAIRPNQRVYVFHSGSWTKNEIALVNRFGYEGLRGLSHP